MKHFVLLSMLFALPLAAQEQKKPEEKPRVQKVFILKYADPNRLSNLLGVFGVAISANPDLHALAVTSSPEIMPAVEDAITRLDVPTASPQNIELTAYYLVGGDAENAPGSAVPKDLESVVAQLKNSFAFKAYHLLDELTLRTRAGQRAETSGSPGPVGQGSPSINTAFRIQSATLSGDGSTVRIDRMQTSMRLPVPSGGGYTSIDLGLSADIDVKEGQKVVVGRQSMSKDQALFLVLTAHVVN